MLFFKKPHLLKSILHLEFENSYTRKHLRYIASFFLTLDKVLHFDFLYISVYSFLKFYIGKNLLFIGFFLGSLFLKNLGFAEESHQLLVVGCGRGGTNYMAKLLQMSGLDVGHECYGDYGRVAWPFTVGGYRYNGIPVKMEPYAHIFHQVRHPLKVIESWMNYPLIINRKMWIFIQDHIPEIKKQDSLIIQCAKYWYYWNLKAEKISEWRYRIDDFENFVDEFECRLGISVSRQAMQSLSKKTNHWIGHKINITHEDLQRKLPQELYENIVQMMTRYGYTF